MITSIRLETPHGRKLRMNLPNLHIQDSLKANRGLVVRNKIKVTVHKTCVGLILFDFIKVCNA